MPASSQASSELSTASFPVVRSALAGLSKPSRWRFLVKNSLTEISRCRVAIDSAVARLLGALGACSGGSTSFTAVPATLSGERVSSTGPSVVGSWSLSCTVSRAMPTLRGPRTILALLTALNLLNYLDRMVLSAVLHDVRDDLHMSKAAAGWAATVFLIGYFATSPIFGTMADRAGTGGRKVLIMVGIVVWSLATIATGLVHSVPALFAARAFVGVGEASYATIAPTLIDEFAPSARKGRWLSIFYTAMPVGSAFGYIVGGGVLAATHDWRMAFFVAGGPGLVLALLCLLIGEPPREASTERPRILDTALKLAAIPAYRNVV